MNKQHIILFAGLLLVLVNAITSGNLSFLWGVVSGQSANYVVPQPSIGQTLNIPGTNSTVTGVPGGTIIGTGGNWTTVPTLQGPHPPNTPVSNP